MGTIITLLIRDFKNIVHSRPVLITLIAFCIIPALYALLNIKASWDPYSPTNTSRLPIAVINNDEGTIINNKSLNVGDQVIEELKKAMILIGLLPMTGRETMALIRENITL